MRFRDEHKKMTRFFGVILALALWVSSAAVGHARTEISIYDWSGSAAGTGLQTLIDEFNATHPDIHVTWVFKGGSSQNLWEALLVGLLGNSPPEMSMVFETHVHQLVDFQDQLLPIQEFIDRGGLSDSALSDFLPIGLDAMAIDGVQVGLPFRFDASIISVNQDMLQESGVAEYPRTWEAVFAEGPKLTKDLNGDGTPEVTAAGWVSHLTWGWAPFLWGAGGDLFNADNTEATFAGPAGVRAAQYFADLMSSGIGSNSSLNQFLASQTVSTRTTNWQTATLLGNAEFDWEGVFWPYPTDVGPEKVRGLTKIAGPVIFRSTPEKEEASWTFLKWLMQPENIARYGVLSAGIPVRRSAFDLDTFQDALTRNPGLQTFINQIDRFKITPFFSKWVEIDFDIIRPALERIISGDVAPETGLEEAQRLANSLLQ